jgi:hypothetical protein
MPPQRNPSRVTRPGAAALAAMLLGARAPQGPVVDAGTFVISRGGVVVGREEFTVRRGRSSGPDGFTITATARYTVPRTNTLAPVVELGADSLPVQVQFDVSGETQARVYARFGQRRITLRMVRPNGESAREFPSTGRTLVADDSVFALYAIRPAPGSLQVLAPRNGQRTPADLVSLGTEQTTLQGVARQLDHWVLRGPDERHLWYDETGRLMRVDLPSLSLSAERESTPR